MQVIYNSAQIPFYFGKTAPDTTFDDQYNQIPDGRFYIDILSHNTYIMSNSAWTLVTDSTTFSSLVPTNTTITSSVINTFKTFNTTRTSASTYYVSNFNNVISVFMPQAQGNAGLWLALEDSLGRGYNIMSDIANGRFKVVDRVGGFTGVSTKHYFICDGTTWHLAKSFLPVVSTGLTTSLPGYIYVDTNNGSDSNGAKYDTAKPYKTITQALALATSGETIYVKTGTYTDFGMTFKDGVTIHFEKGAIIAPTTNSGNVKIFGANGAPSDPGNKTFKITGNGRFLNNGTSNSGTPSIENGGNWLVSVDCDEIASVANWSYAASITVNNAKITQELYSRVGKLSFNNCVIVDTKTTTFNIDWAASGLIETIFTNCTFIRKQAVIPWETNFPGFVAGQGTQGLDNFRFGPVMGGSGARNTSFINCIFINNVGGDAISFKEKAWDDNGSFSPILVISGCKFMLSDNTKSCVLADGSTGVPVSAGFYFDNNISNSPTSTINGGTLVNKLSGTGFQVVSKYKLPNPYPTV